MEGVRNSAGHREPNNPNYYGNTSPSQRHQQSTRNNSGNDGTKITGFNNYGYHSDMQETENHYVVPRVHIDNPEVSTYFN